jgi:hypothetical protein
MFSGSCVANSHMYNQEPAVIVMQNDSYVGFGRKGTHWKLHFLLFDGLTVFTSVYSQQFGSPC